MVYILEPLKVKIMSDNIKSRRELELIFIKTVKNILDIENQNHYSVRRGYGSKEETGAAPGWKREENVVMLSVLFQDSIIDKIRNQSFEDGENNMLTYIDKHTATISLRCTCYGPDCFVWAERLRAGFSRPDIKLILTREEIYRVSGESAPYTANEIFNNEWWLRTDITINFNMAVRIEQINAVNSLDKAIVEIVTENSN